MRVSERVDALSVVPTMWPDAPAAGSPFASDREILGTSSTFDMARGFLVNSLYHLKVAHQLANSSVPGTQGTHLLLLRPALLTAARANWLMAPEQSAERVQRAAFLLADDRGHGLNAMRKILEKGAPGSFESVARLFEGQQKEAQSLAECVVPSVRKRLPREEQLIHQAALQVDNYHGTNDATVDAQLLWNTGSGLTHGERWFATLTSGKSRLVADTITERSFDVLCSLINVTSLRLVLLASRLPAPGGDEDDEKP